MAERSGEALLELVRPINEAAPTAGYGGVYAGASIYIFEKIALYRALALNIFEITMPNRAFTAVFSLIAGLAMGGAISPEIALSGSLALIATYGCGAVYNNIRDIEADKINAAGRPLASGALSVGFAQWLMSILVVGGIALAYIASPILAAACILESVLGVIYSRFTKAMGVLAYATLVTTHMAVPLAAGALISGGFGIQTLAVILFLYVTEVLAVSIKDYKDIEGDRKTGLRTLPIIYGARDASRLTFLGLCLPLILVWIPWGLFGLSTVFLAMYLAIGVSRFRTGRKILEDQSPEQAGKALNSFRLITTMEMVAWCLAWI